TIARLGGGSNGTQRKASRRPKRRRSTKRAKKGQRLDEVSAILKANPKAKTAEIAKQIGISTNQVSGLRKQVATRGNLKKPSQKKRNAKRSAGKAAKPAKKKAAKPKAKAAPLAKAPKTPKAKPA